MKWFECNGCQAEFRVVSDTDALVEFCPFCGDSVKSDDDDEENDEEYEE